MIPLILAALLFHAAVTLWLWRGITAIPRQRQAATQPVSVLVAAHNEEQQIDACVEALLRQDYPAEKMEIILIDDRSTDGTGKKMAAWTKRDGRIRAISVKHTPPEFPPKKFALLQGIEQSRHEILCFTDADCLPEPGWLRAMVSAYGKDTAMVVGVTVLRNTAPGRPKLWQRWRVFESWANSFLAVSSAANRFPLTCGGGSLSYRKSAFEQLGGFETVRQSLSGDDDLLLHRFARRGALQIEAVLEPNALVWTRAPAALNDLVLQKTRHYSAARYYPPGSKIFYLIRHGSHSVLLLFAVIACLFPFRFTGAAFAALGLALTADYFFYRTAFARLRRPVPLADFLLFWLLQPLFTLPLGLAGLLKTPRWKD